MQRLHKAAYLIDHSSGFLKIADARTILDNAYPVIREVVTPPNISYIASRKQC